MLNLDDPRWSTLEGGYKVIYDPRSALELLRASRGRREEAWSELWNELHHQGDIGAASYAAVPHIVDIYAHAKRAGLERAGARNAHRRRTIANRAQAPRMALGVLHGRDSPPARARYANLLRSDDPYVVRSALAAIAIAKGLHPAARILSNYTDEELDEMERLYLDS